MTVSFSTTKFNIHSNSTQKANDKPYTNSSGCEITKKVIEKEPEGKKSEAWRNRFIKKLKNDYNITMTMEYSYSQDKKIPVYKIVAKKDVNLAAMKKELGIRNGVIASCNDGYGQYSNDGCYIDNKEMKNVTIKIPVDKLGENFDDRNLLEQFLDWVGF